MSLRACLQSPAQHDDKESPPGMKHLIVRPLTVLWWRGNAVRPQAGPPRGTVVCCTHRFSSILTLSWSSATTAAVSAVLVGFGAAFFLPKIFMVNLDGGWDSRARGAVEAGA